MNIIDFYSTLQKLFSYTNKYIYYVYFLMSFRQVLIKYLAKPDKNLYNIFGKIFFLKTLKRDDLYEKRAL